MKILRQVLILCFLCVIGQIVSELLPIIIPASVLSMVLLLILLLLNIIKMEQIKETTEFLLANLAFFFVPLTVGIIENYHLIKEKVLIIIFICIVTTFLTFAATAYTVILAIKFMERKGRSL